VVAVVPIEVDEVGLTGGDVVRGPGPTNEPPVDPPDAPPADPPDEPPEGADPVPDEPDDPVDEPPELPPEVPLEDPPVEPTYWTALVRVAASPGSAIGATVTDAHPAGAGGATTTSPLSESALGA
jgi:hypothetical protein